MPRYSFFITEGRNTQEILLGTAPGVTAFLTQRIEFQAENAFMRPGALLTIRAAREYYPLLFLHVASMTGPRGFGLRADKTTRAFEFKKTLDKNVPGPPNYIFLGDLNTMGMEYYATQDPRRPRLKVRVEPAQELAGLAYQAEQFGMRVLPKTADATWRGRGTLRSNLDHVVAAKHLKFRAFAAGREVSVRGWPELASNVMQSSRAWSPRMRSASGATSASSVWSQRTAMPVSPASRTRSAVRLSERSGSPDASRALR
jgi:hypothetical protein